jgi:hypothetical protein
MENKKVSHLIERAWDNGYVGDLGPRPAKYHLYVEDNHVIFSKFDQDDEELVHLCLNCILLSREFVQCLLGVEPDLHLKELVCMTSEQKVKYLSDRVEGLNSTVYTV